MVTRIFINRASSEAFKCSLSLNPAFEARCAGFLFRNFSSYQFNVKENVKDCYSLLNISEDCDKSELKDAYMKLAKEYHPDSRSPKADAVKFSQVQQAYKDIVEHRQQQSQEVPAEEEIIIDIKHTAPQHRQYLSFEGIGSGTPSQRQKQYTQHKVSKAAKNVFEYQQAKLASADETALVIKDKQAAKKTKVSNAIERVVEDLIQDAMNKGDFDNLSGRGKPLKYAEINPFVDNTTHNINKVLINNGYVPEWITLEKEIRLEIKKSREHLSIERKRMGSLPHHPAALKRWSFHVDKFKTAILDINLMIDKFNMVVPILDRQMVQYNAKVETARIFDNYEKYFPAGKSGEESKVDFSYTNFSQTSSDKIEWKDVWANIKSVFNT